MKTILAAAMLSLALAGFASSTPARTDAASPIVLAQDNSSNTGSTGDTFAPTKPGDAPLSDPSLDSGPPSELDNGGTSDSLRGEPNTAPSAGFSGSSSTSQGLGAGSSFGGSSSTSQSLSTAPLSR